MREKDLVRSIIDFSFIIKSQLQSEDTALLRSVLNILIMEAEDVLEVLSETSTETSKITSRMSR